MITISAPEPISQKLIKFINDSNIALEVVAEDGDLKIELSGEQKLKSNLSTLYSGSWVSCATARATAANLAITLKQMGEMLNVINVKVKQCGLGCF